MLILSRTLFLWNWKFLVRDEVKCSLKITNKLKSIHAVRVCVCHCVCVCMHVCVCVCVRSSRTSSSCEVYSTSTLRTL